MGSGRVHATRTGTGEVRFEAEPNFSVWPRPLGRARPSLRQADWRFMLPSPAENAFDHVLLLGGSGELAEDLVDVGFAARVSRDPSVDGVADAVVMLAESRHSLEAVARSLRSGAVVYYEADRRLRGPRDAPRHVRARLADLGLAIDRAYWLGMQPHRHRVFVPYGEPGPLRWYRDHLLAYGSPARALPLALPLPILWRVLKAASPRFAVVARAPGAHRPMRWLALENGAWWAANPPITLGFAPGGWPWSRAILLQFDGRPEPLAVVKAARCSELNRYVEHEHAVLLALRERLDGEVGAALPWPLGTRRWMGLAVSAEAYVPGRKFSQCPPRPASSIEEQLRHLRLAVSWIADFHSQTRVSAPLWGEAQIAQYVDAPTAAYVEEVGATPNERALFAGMRRWANSLVGLPLPLVWRHKDFADWNLLHREPGLAVLDWEVSSVGPAGCDLLYYIWEWSRSVSCCLRPRSTEHFVIALLGGNRACPTLARVADHVTVYLDRLRLDRRFLPLLLVYTHVQQALDHVARLLEGGIRVRERPESIPQTRVLHELGGRADLLFSRQSRA